MEARHVYHVTVGADMPVKLKLKAEIRPARGVTKAHLYRVAVR
jgi:hypothetical protein